MTDDEKKPASGERTAREAPQKSEREMRAARALRENLKRRKAQVKARTDSEIDTK